MTAAASRSRSTYDSPWLLGVAAASVAVRLEQGAGVVLQHAVGHDLDARGVVVADDPVLALRQELRDLLEALVAVPPQRADDASRQASVVRPALGRPRACPASPRRPATR